MKDFLQFAPIGLVIWWLAQTCLSLCDYSETRHKVRRMPPPSEEEMKALAIVRAAGPAKERKSFRWYIEHPVESLKHGWIFIPVLVFFWPMAVLLHTLPRLETRLPPHLVQRINSEGL